MIETLTALLFAHIIADFVLQPGWMVARKKDPGIFLAHIAVVILAAMAATGRADAPELLIIGAAHLVIDAAKTYLAPQGLAAFLGDQAAHLVSILAVTLYNPGLWQSGIWAGYGGFLPHAMVLLAGFVLATRAGGFAVGMLMTPWAESAPEGLPNGGKLIGLLERGLIFVLVHVGLASGIGFLIAAKSILRFDTTTKQPVGEYVIIGTLASFGWAVSVAFATKALLGALPPLEIAP